MPSPFFSRLLLAALVLVSCPQLARCDPIFWDYSSFVFPSFVAPDVGAGVPSAFPLIGVNLEGTSARTADATTIILASTWSSGELPAGKTATFKHQRIQMALGIQDRASNRSDMAFFTGYIDGTLSTNRANLSFSFPEKVKSLHIGKNIYKINLSTIIPPGPPGRRNPFGSSAPVRPDGFVWAKVTVQKNPEPSTLLLLGMGGSFAAALYARRRRAPH